MTSRPLSRIWAEARIAVATLTRIPVGTLAAPVPSLAASRWAFPIAGLAVGGVVGAFHFLFVLSGIPMLVAGFLAVGIGIIVTGALHEDGLADCADGFWSGGDRVRKLDVMRDSRNGTFGTLALALSVLLRGAAIAALSSPFLAIVCIAVLSRAAMVAAIEWLPSAREDGLGASVADEGTNLLFCGVFGVAVCLLFVWSFGVGALLALAAMIITGLMWGRLARRQIGGQTGDVLGGLQQVTEIAGLIMLSALAI